MAVLPLSNGWYQDENPNISEQDCLNLIPSIVNTRGALNVDTMRSPSGIEEHAETGRDPCRGLIRFKNGLYGVFGDQFYQIFDSGTLSPIGPPIKGEGRIAMAENGEVIVFIIPGTRIGYFYNFDTNDIEEITDPVFFDFGVKLDVTYANGFFTYLTPDVFFLGSFVNTNNGKDFDALQFATLDAATDQNIGIQTIKGELYIFGQSSTEVFAVTPAPDFPYVRVDGATVDRGLLTRESVIPFQDSYVFIGAGKNEGISVWNANHRISTAAIDNLLQGLPREDLANTFMFKYAEGGNYFVGFTVPNQITLVYDLVSQVWHRRSSEQDGTGTLRASHFEQVYGDIYVGDIYDGRIGRLSDQIFTEYGDMVLRRFSTIYFNKEGLRFKVPVIELKSTIGTRFPIKGVTQQKQIVMRTSRDGGVNFTNGVVKILPDDPSSSTRTIWRRIGNFDYSAVFQFDVLIDRKFAITKVVAGVI